MNVKAIVLKSADGVIATPIGSLPFGLREDLQHFKHHTQGHAIVMGRKTWDSLPIQPLPDRLNIILSRTPSKIPGAVVATNSGYVTRLATMHQLETLWVIGGAEIYKEFDTRIEEWYVTEVHTILGEGLKLPPLDPAIWVCDERVNAKTFEGVFKRYVRRS